MSVPILTPSEKKFPVGINIFLMKFKAKNLTFEIFYIDLWGVYVL